MTAIPTWSVSLPSGNIAYWLYHSSPTSYNQGGFATRGLVWDTAGGAPTALYSGGTCYGLVGFRLVQGAPGRMLDIHNVSVDSPWEWAPKYCSGDASGSYVAPLAIDYWNDSRGLDFVAQVEQSTGCGGSGQNHYQILTQAETEARRGTWIWLWLEIVFGRRPQDVGDADRAGSARVWVAGENTPRVNLAAPRHTIYYQQHQVGVIQGAYWSTGSPGCTVEHAAVRFGRTPQECYLDTPAFVSSGNAGGTTGGSVTDIADRQHDEAAIPTELDWGTPSGDTTAPVLQSAAILNNGSTLQYNEPLSAASVPLVSDYVYKVNGSPVTISSTEWAGDHINVYLQSPVGSGDTVTVSYTRSSGHEVKDLVGNMAANLTDQAVTNNTPPDAVTSRVTTIARSTSVSRVSDNTARVPDIGGGGI